MKIGGVTKTFNTVVVNQQPYVSEGINYVDLIITASNNGSTSEFITFSIGKEDVGENLSWDFNYTLNEVVYSEDKIANQIVTNASTNIDKKLIGTFSGTVASETNEKIEITQGSFDITY